MADNTISYGVNAEIYRGKTVSADSNSWITIPESGTYLLFRLGRLIIGYWMFKKPMLGNSFASIPQSGSTTSISH